MSERFKEPVLKTGDAQASVGSNPTLSAIFQNRTCCFRPMRKYPSGRRGSPAKGVDVQTTCEGSNPSFRAKPKALRPDGCGAFLLSVLAAIPFIGFLLFDIVSASLAMATVATVCLYGIIRTHRKTLQMNTASSCPR